MSKGWADRDLDFFPDSNIFTLSRPAVDSRKEQVVPSLLTVMSGAETSASYAHAHKISDLQFSLVI